MFGLGTQELMVILVIAMLLFGAQKLPELARGLGKSVKEFQNATSGRDEPEPKAPAPAPPVANSAVRVVLDGVADRVESLPTVRRDRVDDAQRDGCVVSKAARPHSGFRHFYTFCLAFAL